MKHLFKYAAFAACGAILAACGNDTKTLSGVAASTVGWEQRVEIGSTGESTLFVTPHENDGAPTLEAGQIGSLKNIEIASVGECKKISNVTEAPSSGWAAEASLANNTGYVVTAVNGKRKHYFRLHTTVTDVASPQAEIKITYQEFLPE